MINLVAGSRSWVSGTCSSGHFFVGCCESCGSEFQVSDTSSSAHFSFLRVRVSGSGSMTQDKPRVDPLSHLTSYGNGPWIGEPAPWLTPLLQTSYGKRTWVGVPVPMALPRFQSYWRITGTDPTTHFAFCCGNSFIKSRNTFFQTIATLIFTNFPITFKFY